jgi:hypothetical protein
VRSGDSTFCIKPDNLSAEQEEGGDLLGETVIFEAGCLLVDLDRLLSEIDAVWDEYRQGGTGLLAATAMTNACVRHAEGLLTVRPLMLH